jgi:hypothetical protein
MAGNLVLPRKAIDKYSKIESPVEYAAEIFKQIKLDTINVTLNRVLCAVYIGYEKMASGLYRSSDNIAEDIWQNKAVLVLKLGPMAFRSTNDITFGDAVPKPGDWVTFKIGNASQIELNDFPCRITLDHYIESRIEDPRQVTS